MLGTCAPFKINGKWMLLTLSKMDTPNPLENIESYFFLSFSLFFFLSLPLSFIAIGGHNLKEKSNQTEQNISPCLSC